VTRGNLCVANAKGNTRNDVDIDRPLRRVHPWRSMN
jgi:hypothetical protein